MLGFDEIFEILYKTVFIMLFRTFSKKALFIAAMFLAAPAVAGTVGGGNSKVAKPVWQDSDPNKEYYFNNRRALVGPGCMINSLFDGVEVVSGTKDLQNICNDDLDDYATIPALVGATVVASPIISIKDNQHYYAGGTEAGFVICAKSDASILTLDLAKFYKIQFLKDGKAVGDLQSISTGKSVTGLGLSLLTIPGSDQVNKLYMATAPGNFDEIKLVQCGVDAKLGSAINIKYAFVGKAREYTITNNKENGISKYAEEQDKGRRTFTLDAQGKKPTYTSGEASRGDVIDANLDNGYAAVVGALIPVSTPVTVVAKPSDGKEAFPKGTEVGFKFNGFNLANLSVGSGVELTLFNKENEEIGKYDISNKLLGLGLIEDTKDGEVVMRAPAAFSAAKIFFKGIGIEVGGTSVNYAFVRMAPELASHHCPLNITASTDVCGCENTFDLQHNDSLPVTWSVVSQPEGSNVTLNATTGHVESMYIPGKYVFQAKAKDGCTETTTVNYAPTYNPEENGVKILVNKEGEAPKYSLSDKFGGGLLQIADGVKNRAAILTSTLNDFAKRGPEIALAANSGIVGVKTVKGALLGDGFNGKMQAGFVVTRKTTGLNADVLKLYNIQLFNKGEKVKGEVTTHWDAISAGLIGKDNAQKMRLSVDVPEGCQFDEMVLYSTGVLSADLDQLNIYYAYVSDATSDNATTNMLYGAEVVSTENTNASIDFANTKMFQVAGIGNGYNELANLIDDDLNTYLTTPLGADVVDGTTIAVNIGKMVNPTQQLVMVTNKLALGVGLGLGNVLKLSTWRDGKFVEDLTDWKVLDADVIGSTGDSYAVLSPSKPFDQVRITPIRVVSALKGMQIKGFALRNTMSDDGILGGCDDVLVLDENKQLAETKTYSNAKMLLHRTFTQNENDPAKGWNSVILPVDMTEAQVTEAFGEGTQIAEFDKVMDNWIHFSTAQADDNQVILHKNTPYIINPTKEPYGNYTYTIKGETNTLEGPVYVANGINYSDETGNLSDHHTGSEQAGMYFYGSYAGSSVVTAGAYMFSKGNLVHTNKTHSVKPYRCWLVETTPSDKSYVLSIDGAHGDATGINVVEENHQTAGTGIYSIDGVRMNTNDVNALPKGVYIINNKVVVK